MHLLRSTTRQLLVLAALVAAPAYADVVINEIMYHSVGDVEVEYIELVNAGDVAEDITGWTLIDGEATHDPCVLVGTLEPGELIVAANVLDWFAAAYPGVSNVNPNAFGGTLPDVGFGLGNNSEEIFLHDAAGELRDAVNYLDDPPWPPEPDGSGPSLELVNPAADNADVMFWRASLPTHPTGTPGAQNSVYIPDLPPVVSALERSPLLPTATGPVSVTARAEDDGTVAAVTLFVDSGSGFAPTAMADDGLHDDGAAGNGKFGARIPALPTGTIVRYYVTATDDLGQTAAVPADAPEGSRAYTVDHVPPVLRVNEILASNLTGILDGNGEPEDWLELRNPGPYSWPLEGMFLTNDLDATTMWELPDVILRPGEKLLFWCDGQPLEGPFHTSFTLPRSGGAVALFDTVEGGNTLIHGFTYGPQTADIAFGYRPEDADAPEYLATPTPAASNKSSAYFSPLCINEFLAASQIGVGDWVEIYNRGDSTIDASGWYLSDDPKLPTRYALPAGTVLAPGEAVTFDETVLGFGFAASGNEALLLTRPDGAAGADWFDFGPQFSDISQGRFADGTPNWHFFSAWSAALPNVCPQLPGPGVVEGFAFDTRAAAVWQPVAEATGYDVVTGDLAGLRRNGGDFSAAIRGCTENNSVDTATWVPGNPPSGGARFYLVRSTNRSCGFGSWDPASPPPAGSRDPSIGAAGPSCP